MKPFKFIRWAKGYMGIWDDGPYNKWKKKIKRSFRKKERRKSRDDIRKLED